MFQSREEKHRKDAENIAMVVQSATVEWMLESLIKLNMTVNLDPITLTANSKGVLCSIRDTNTERLMAQGQGETIFHAMQQAINTARHEGVYNLSKGMQ